MLKKSLVTFWLLLFCQLATAAASPEVMLQQTSDRMLQALQQNKSRIQQQPSYVYSLARDILLPKVDTNAMSRLALGRDAWTKASPEQRKQFTVEFTELMLRTYGSALSSYTDEQIKFKPLRGGVENKKRVQIDSVILQRGGPSIPVSYRLFLRNDQWKVYDISVDGVSMVQSFKSQFTNELSRGGMDGLLAAMKGHRIKQ